MPDCILTCKNSHTSWNIRKEPITVDIGTYVLILRAVPEAYAVSGHQSAAFIRG